MSISFTGLGAGFDVSSVVDQLMQLESRPLTTLQNKADVLGRQVTALTGIRNKLTAVTSAAETLADVSEWSQVRASVSDPTVASASATGSTSGSLTFRVDQLASRHTIRSSGTVSSLTDPVVSGTSRLVVGTGFGSYGVAGLTASATVPTGDLDIDIVSVADGARLVGTSALDSTTTISVSNRSFSLRVDGGGLTTATIATGTYDPAGLVAAVDAALDDAGLQADASLDDAGRLVIQSRSSGASSEVIIQSGNALAPLKLAAGTATGTDGVISVNGSSQVVTDTGPGAVITLSAGAGTIQLTAGDTGLSAGQFTAAVVDATDVGLGDLVDRLNATGLVDAAAVRVGDSSWRLQMSSLTSGTAGLLTIDDTMLSTLGSMVVSGEGRDARLVVGDGAGAYDITSTTNTFTGLLPGVDVTVQDVGTTTVRAQPVDMSSTVQQFVAAANDLLTEIRTATRNSPGSSGPLAGDFTMRRLADSIVSSVLSPLDPTVGRAGLSIDRTGAITFDAAEFRSAVATDRDAVASLFQRQVSGSDTITLAGASSRTLSGQWEVVVSQAATRADSGLLTASDPITVSQQGLTLSYTPIAGQDATTIARTLNSRLADAGIAVEASVEGGSLRLTSRTWGSAGSFAAGSDPAALTTYQGVDAVGTIDGKVAAGRGQVLALGDDVDSGARGLELEVTATGTFATTYEAGIAGRLYTLTANSTDSSHPLQGALTIRDRQIEAVEQRVIQLEQRLEAKEVQLRRMYALLDANLGKLNSLSDWISSQVESLPTIGANRRNS